jgi:glycosyltransferase involved in cell wall biosynthesis
MNVIINGMAAVEQKTGVGHYIERVHRELSLLNRATLFPGKLMKPIVAKLAPRTRRLGQNTSTGKTTELKNHIGALLKQSSRAAAQAYFSTFTMANRFDLYHEPNYIPFRTNLPTVITAHDLSVLLHPEWHPAERVKIHEAKFLPAIHKANHVITGSEQVRQELLAYMSISPNKVSAVYYGIGEEFKRLPENELNAVKARLQLPERFLLYVGAVEPRKNLLTALKAFVDMPTEERRSCPLLLAGPWAWKATDVANFFRDYAQPAGARHLGYVSDQDRVALYNCAAALIYPSRYEGFGLPPLEMLACGGGGVLAATAKAVVEVLKPHGFFIDPDDQSGWRNAMINVARDRDFFGKDRSSAMKHAQQYTWTRCAQETLAVYHKALGKKAVDNTDSSNNTSNRSAA